MNLDLLLPLIKETPGLQRVAERLRGSQPVSPFVFTWELLDAARPAALAALHSELRDTPMLVLTSEPERARTLQEQVALWSHDPRQCWYFPAPDALYYDRTPWDGETIRRRVNVLCSIAAHPPSWKPPVIFSSIWALMTLTTPPLILASGIQTVRVGDTVRLSQILETLVRYAYEPMSIVEQPGTFSSRGGILDIFPPNLDKPVRIELFGDEVESIRYFDPMTQRSLEQVDAVTLFPASEALTRYSQSALPGVVHDGVRDPVLASRLQRDQERLAAGEYFRGFEFYLPCLYPRRATLLDYFVDKYVLVIDSLPAVESAMEALQSQAADLRNEQVADGLLSPEFPPPYRSQSELWPMLRAARGVNLGYAGENGATEHETERSFHLAPRFGGQLRQLVAESLRLKDKGNAVLIVSRQALRMANLFEEEGLPTRPVQELSAIPDPGTLTLLEGLVAEGWRLDMENEAISADGKPSLVLLTDTEIFGWSRPARRPFARKKAASPESLFAQIHEGDYVVHIEHGVGIYRGLKHERAGGVEREYLELEYDAGDRLYVPVSQVDRLSRYVGNVDLPPPLYRLGSSDWVRVRSQAKKAVQEIAHDLLALYAAREVLQRHAYSPDTVWQTELESSFPYEDTEDQRRALAEIKQDMEKSNPMDRLICGDVGYGKTEVAIRAAFKAVMDGKQVAVLVPTTILAQQHLETFKQRMAAFPVQVDMLSRFRSPQEQKDTLERLKEGQVDIIIGTHRLIQKDVEFKDLGLLIIDEEQRFGVRHKEWLKRMRYQVDVLTLTATPIPRTLYLSLAGVRDMSIIDTPPEERLPVRTVVNEYDEKLIRRAVLRELNRGGQVYFVHNRVQGIQQIAQRLQKVVPEATIAVAHGQMPEEELSRVMFEFGAGKYDILVCTSIIESGLDIPNVNTIIINRADRFGLAQLYQLRGRVGRSAVQAYAYLLYPHGQRLSDIARRRLVAIVEASELGSGYQIAMRDLELRGAGEILGAEQHGHIAAIGFDLYSRLLAQAVRELREGKPREEAAEIKLPPVIELPIQAQLPDDYVSDEALRLTLYQRMTGIQSEDELEEIRRELEDRFGILPEPAENLLFVLRVRTLAEQAGVESIAREENAIVFKLQPGALTRARAIVAHVGRRAWIGKGQLWLSLPREDEEWRELLMAILVRLRPTPETVGEPVA